MKPAIRTALIITVLAFIAYGVFDLVYQVYKIGKNISPLSYNKTQKPDAYNFLFKTAALKNIQFRHTDYNDRGKTISSYVLDSLNKEILVFELDDATHPIPKHIVIQEGADLMGSFNLEKLPNCSVYSSIELFNLSNDLNIAYEGIPLHFEVINPDFFYFRSSALKKLSVHFQKHAQAAYALESEGYSAVYDIEFALVRKNQGNFLVFSISKDKTGSNGRLLPEILNV